jgi:hypothetical protein
VKQVLKSDKIGDFADALDYFTEHKTLDGYVGSKEAIEVVTALSKTAEISEAILSDAERDENAAQKEIRSQKRKNYKQQRKLIEAYGRSAYNIYKHDELWARYEREQAEAKLKAESAELERIRLAKEAADAKIAENDKFWRRSSFEKKLREYFDWMAGELDITSDGTIAVRLQGYAAQVFGSRLNPDCADQKNKPDAGILRFNVRAETPGEFAEKLWLNKLPILDSNEYRQELLSGISAIKAEQEKVKETATPPAKLYLPRDVFIKLNAEVYGVLEDLGISKPDRKIDVGSDGNIYLAVWGDNIARAKGLSEKHGAVCERDGKTVREWSFKVFDADEFKREIGV